jgi:hypothetical protein
MPQSGVVWQLFQNDKWSDRLGLYFGMVRNLRELGFFHSRILAVIAD